MDDEIYRLARLARLAALQAKDKMTEEQDRIDRVQRAFRVLLPKHAMAVGIIDLTPMSDDIPAPMQAAIKAYLRTVLTNPAFIDAIYWIGRISKPPGDRREHEAVPPTWDEDVYATYMRAFFPDKDDDHDAD